MEPQEYAKMAGIEDGHWWYRGLRDVVVSECRRRGIRGLRLLDVGCGTGGTIRDLERSGLGLSIVGLDASPLALELAGRRCSVPLVRGDANALPCSTAAFDAIVTLDVLNHASVDERKAFGELCRVLRPGGFALVHVAAFDWLRSYHDSFVHTARRFSAGGLRNLAMASGFEVVRCEYRNSLLFPIMVVERLFRKRFPPRQARSAVIRHARLPNAFLGGVLRVENRLFTAGFRFPAGGSVFAVLRKSE